jgi:hypothetical protein
MYRVCYAAHAKNFALLLRQLLCRLDMAGWPIRVAAVVQALEEKSWDGGRAACEAETIFLRDFILELCFSDDLIIL